MTVISPLEVERFPLNSSRPELKDLINGLLRSTPAGITVWLSEANILEEIGSSGGRTIREGMEELAQVYRAVGW